MNHLAILLATVLAAGGAVPNRAPATVDHSDYDVILRAVVRGEGVDYGRVAREFLPALDAYLKRLDETALAGLSDDASLALHVNLYNATVLRHVAERFAPGYSVEEDGFGIFDEPLVQLGGNRITLNQLEHDVIRATFGEPRIHVALVCAARSCPPLPPRAYRARDLDETLETNMRRFVNDTARNRIDAGRRRLELSRIFEWFAEDFGGKDALARYVDDYTGHEVAGFEVAFLEYDWRLNVAEDSR